MQFLSTLPSFLHIMMRPKKKKQTLFYAFNYLSFELYSITDDENEYETIFIFFVKI